MDIKVPAAGESITQGVLLSWMTKDGRMVDKDQTIFLFETDKVNLEVPAPCRGVVKILVKEGTKVSVGDVVGRIDPVESTPVVKTEETKTPEPVEVKIPVSTDDYKLAAETLAKEVLAWRNRDINKPNDIYSLCEETNRIALEDKILARVLGFIVERNQ